MTARGKMPWVGAAAMALVLVAGGAAAQTVVTEGSSDVALDRRIARLLEADPLILTQDSHIPRGDTVARSVLVLDATLIHEGVILGDLVLVDAGAFVRHDAVVNGDLVNAAGGLYRSERARVGGAIIDLPEASYRVIRDGERMVIEATETPSRLSLDGFMGLRTPTYDRVNGLTATVGARYRLPRVRNTTPTVAAHGGWRTELGAPVYGAELAFRTGALTLAGGYDHGWRTREDWAWTDLRNSLNYLWDGDDFRNYYDADRGWFSFGRVFGDEAKSLFAELQLIGQVEDARSLGGDRPWNLLGGTPRPNPAVSDGRITSATVKVDIQWHGLTTDLVGGVEYEAGRGWVDGDFGFDRIAAGAKFAMEALLTHTLQIRAFGQLPLGTDSLPKQRWSILGGATTLNTVAIGAFRGDRVAWVETRYTIPMPEVLGLPILGPPDLQLLHGAGKAWTSGETGELVQEVGARLQFFSLYVEYAVQPADPGRDRLVVGLAWPFAPAYPWELGKPR